MNEGAGSQHEREKTRVEPVNVGVAPEKKEGKPICEDAKVNDPKKGLFMVADGVSKSDGARASRFVAEQAQRFLGDDLDKGIRNNFAARGVEPAEQINNIDFLVKTSMVEMLNDSHEKLRGVVGPEAGTTVSLSKLVDLPNGNTRMYFANVGDSRIYVVRNGKLRKLTVDDNAMFEQVGKEVAPGVVFTKKDARAIDQARSVDDLSDDQRMVKRYVGSTISKMIGQRGAEKADLGYVAKLTEQNNDGKHKEIQSVDLIKGDKVLITSDGVHNQLLETEMESLMRSGGASSLELESAMQAKAKETSDAGKGINPRSKKDDISAVVYTVGEGDREKLYEAEVKSASPTKEDVDKWRGVAKVLFEEMRSLKKELDRAIADKSPVDEIRAKRVVLNEKQQEWARYDYGIKKDEYERGFAQFDKENATTAEKQQMALLKAKKDNAEKRYRAYIQESRRLG